MTKCVLQGISYDRWPNLLLKPEQIATITLNNKPPLTFMKNFEFLLHHTSDQSPTRAPFAYSFCVSLSGPVIL